jgi:hypothetical protein
LTKVFVVDVKTFAMRADETIGISNASIHFNECDLNEEKGERLANCKVFLDK